MFPHVHCGQNRADRSKTVVATARVRRATTIPFLATPFRLEVSGDSPRTAIQFRIHLLTAGTKHVSKPRARVSIFGCRWYTSPRSVDIRC